MGQIIYFEEDAKRKCVIRFVKNYREGGWFRKEQIEYSLSSVDGNPFSDNNVKARICDRIMKDYPNAKIYCTEYAEFFSKYKLHQFWVVCRYDRKGNETGYYSYMFNGQSSWTESVEDAEISLSGKDSGDTAEKIRRKTGDRIASKPVYLNLVNGLLEPCLIITCTSRKGKQETKYLSRIEGNRLRLVTTSDSACRYTYKDAVETFEHLKSHNKGFLYAVLPVFRDNVNCKDIEKYIRDNKISRMLQMTTKLRWLNR